MEERIPGEKRKPEEIVAKLLNCEVNRAEIDYQHHNTRPCCASRLSMNPARELRGQIGLKTRLSHAGAVFYRCGNFHRSAEDIAPRRAVCHRGCGILGVPSK